MAVATATVNGLEVSIMTAFSILPGGKYWEKSKQQTVPVRGCTRTACFSNLTKIGPLELSVRTEKTDGTGLMERMAGMGKMGLMDRMVW